VALEQQVLLVALQYPMLVEAVVLFMIQQAQ
jgi:hypothetical protein